MPVSRRSSGLMALLALGAVVAVALRGLAFISVQARAAQHGNPLAYQLAPAAAVFAAPIAAMAEIDMERQDIDIEEETSNPLLVFIPITAGFLAFTLFAPVLADLFGKTTDERNKVGGYTPPPVMQDMGKIIEDKDKKGGGGLGGFFGGN
eukprot:TRINITY_DN13273_c0_g1_i1.p1 TRINITY_DN13273_c0_g1~~TRINITY_DN13273_c0_g1_i1.p1  ORF type:complete len:150 (-),score=50.72 TRINITY_DN13273_c0_g1_i1:409-858(-)